MKKANAILILLLISLAVYSNSLFSGFVWDDHTLIVQKQSFFSHPENVFRVLASPDAPLGVETPYYRPLNTLSYMLDHYLWGVHPFWYHLENVLLHALVVMVFYLLLLEVFGDGRLAFIAAVLFAVYPVNAEAVDAIFNRNVLFCALFTLASLLFLARGRKKMSFLAYFLALLSKEPGIVLPFFLLSFGLTTGGKFKIKKDVLAGFLGVTAIYLVIRRFVLGVFSSGPGVELSFARLKLISMVYFEHFRLFVFPFKLDAQYTVEQMYFYPVKAALSAAATLVLLYFSLKKKIPDPLRAGSQWVFWGLLPVSGIVKIPSGPVAERYQYTVLFGFVLIVGYLVAELQKKRTLTGAAIIAALALPLGARTFARNFIWKDDTSFFSSMIRANPDNAQAYVNLGTVYGEMGDTGKAIREFKAAVALGYPRAWLNLGIAHAKEGRLDKAISEFKKALALKPGLVDAMSHLALAYEQEGRLDKAEHEYKTALALDPGFSETRVNLGVVYAREGRFPDAVREYKEALAVDPGLDLARMDLGMVYWREGQGSDAVRELRKAINLNPGNVYAVKYLDWIESQMGNEK